jgi:gliding motility-associated-like protein
MIKKVFLFSLTIFAISFKGLFAQCSGITFTTNDTVGCTPLIGKFTAKNFPAGSDFSWDFGSGYSSRSSVDSIKINIYNSAGTFTVSLKVYLPGSGPVCTITKNNYISVSAKPTVQFTINKTLLCGGGDTVTFTDVSVGSADRNWLIDGVSYLNGPKVLKHYFNLSGYKSVSLSIHNSIGCFAIKNIDSAVNVISKPKIDFVSNILTGCSPLNITFTPIDSGFLYQTITSYSWSFPGSATPATSTKNPTVLYNTAGSFNVSLTITTNLGCTYTVTKTAYINVGSPVSITFLADKTTPCASQVIRLINTTVGVPLPGTITWVLPKIAGITKGDTSSDTVYIQIPNTGTYTIGLKYLYNNCFSSLTKTNYLTVTPPTAMFSSLDQINCTIPDTVAITNMSVMPLTGINTYSWTVTDTNNVIEATSTAVNPTFIINKFGRFTVQLISSNSNGCSDIMRLNNFIIVDTAAANFSAFPLFACTGQPISFYSTTPLFSKAPNRFKWTFYSHDKIHTLNYSMNGTDTLPNPIVVYDTVGIYKVRMVIFNKFGCGDTLIKDTAITIGKDTADFTSDNQNICAGNTILFIQDSRPQIATLVHSWVIQHTDSSNITMTGTGNTIKDTFLIPGKYDVKYVSKNATYCSDSITKKDYIKVSGIKAKPISNKTSGCALSTINFSTALIYNFHFVSPSVLIQYRWTCDTAGNGAVTNGYSIANSTSSATGITFSKNGTYKVNCTYINSEGCVYMDTLNAIIINIGMKAYFDILPRYCLYDTGFVVNNSILNPVSYKWLSDGAVSFSPSDTSKNPILLFSLRGLHPVSLIAKSIDGCVDTMKKNIVITKPTANFFSNDTLTVCGPSLVTFHSRSSSDVVLHTWDFGDGSPALKTTDTTASHVFSIKNGRSLFKVMLTVEDTYGCKDFMVKQNYVRILGPVPFFTITGTKGCEPLTVHITDSSKDVFKFYFNYGFGPVDSITIADKIYTLSSPTLIYSVYKPFLVVEDSTGTCIQFYQPLDSIVVYSKPKAYFYTNNRTTCVQSAVFFNDTSVGAVKWKWDFDGDGIIDDTTQNPFHTYSSPGKFTVKLIVINQFGCSDTLVKINYIEAIARPVAKFSVSDTVVCRHTAISFTNQSTSVSPLVKYHWDFGVPGLFTDTSGMANPPPFTYDITGLYTVKLYILDSTGCDDSLVKTNVIRVLDSVPPDRPEIYYLTVVNDKDIRIVWNKNQSNNFNAYNLYRNDGGSFINLVSKNVVTDTTYLDATGINVKTQSYNYALGAMDKCSKGSILGTIHNSIYLDATTLSQNSNIIKWTGYHGWNPGSYNYKLYRNSTYAGTYSFYAQLTDLDTFFIDKNLCDSDYFYYVEAINVGTNFVSRSNIDFNHPPFYIPKTPTELIRATVINDKDILVEWDTSGIVNTNKKLYLLDKLDAAGIFRNIKSTTTNSHIDSLVDVHAKYYTYRVRMQDYCGNIIPESNIGRSIYLSATNNDYNVLLSWNPYDDWANKVKQYGLEFYNSRDKKFTLVAIIPGTDTTYNDTQFYNTDSAYCYRVSAIEDGQAIPDTSVSNLAYIFLPPKLNVPNAFSPNDDGINDVFYAQGIFIQNLTGKPPLDYLLIIYDRWGSELFETNDITKGWDGTFHDKPCEEGVYIYNIRATGFDKHRFNYRGTLQLLR